MKNFKQLFGMILFQHFKSFYKKKAIHHRRKSLFIIIEIEHFIE
jgi:hypothetical protein